jgi:hypothetical protein
VSIGFDWRATMMANSSRDPYWQASVRRETIDHAESTAEIEDTCARCHMPMERLRGEDRGRKAQVFAHLPFKARRDGGSFAEDGVSCSLCHQIGTAKLGTPRASRRLRDRSAGRAGESPRVRSVCDRRRPHARDEDVERGFVPAQSEHIRKSEMCATCHTLITETLGPGGASSDGCPSR